MTHRTVREDRANLHRPDAEGIAAEVLRLHGDGLTARDIAELFHMQVSEIETILRNAP